MIYNCNNATRSNNSIGYVSITNGDFIIYYYFIGILLQIQAVTYIFID